MVISRFRRTNPANLDGTSARPVTSIAAAPAKSATSFVASIAAAPATPATRFAARLAALLAAALAAAILLVSCSENSGFDLRLDAIRSTTEPEKPVTLSLWIYPEGGEKEISKLFVSEKITDRDWISLDGDFFSIVADLLTTDRYFAFRMELNPNRFAAPPDAIFRASLPLADLAYDKDGLAGPIVIRAQQAPYEIRIFVRNRSEN